MPVMCRFATRNQEIRIYNILAAYPLSTLSVTSAFIAILPAVRTWRVRDFAA